MWRRLCEGGDEIPCHRELLKLHLRKQGVDLEDIRFIHVKNSKDAGNLAENLHADANARLIVVVVEFMEMLDVWRRDNPRDPAPKEKMCARALANGLSLPEWRTRCVLFLKAAAPWC